MAGYDFLKGLRVLEVAQLGPSSLGGYLADMGAEVIKVESREGDPVRYSGSPAAGHPDGPSFLHLRWNRGKKSLGLDLKSEAGAALFRRLAASADVVIEGMRAGVLDRLGLGWQALRAANPRLVFCSISGLGGSGPYHRLGSHGPSFDAFGGLSWANPYAEPGREDAPHPPPVGMHAMGLYAAVGVLSAVIRARQAGSGAYLEIAAADCAAHWRPDGVDTVLNEAAARPRPGFHGARGIMACWPRLFHYRTADGKAIFFQALSPAYWQRFCLALEREDLLRLYQTREVNAADELAHAELARLFLQRPKAQWLEFFLQHDIPGGPANTLRDLAQDPHFLARDNVYETALGDGTPLRLSSTPIKTEGQSFSPAAAPALAQDTDRVLASLLALPAAEIAALRERGTIF
jgi:crotonobetainyl-CoA:carnitine CoA-transferase CaiB-like acyl-CoA transferase